MRSFLLLAALAVSASFVASASANTTYYIPTYQVTDDAANPITDICMFWEGPGPNGGPGLFWGGSGEGIYANGGGVTTDLSDLPKPEYPDVFLMGLYDDGSAEHLVLFMDPTTAAAEEGVDFNTAFPDWSESQLVSDMLTINNPNDDWNDALNDIFGFGTGDAQNIPDGGSTLSAWVTPYPNGAATPGTIEMWSTGTPIGSFTTSIQSEVVASTPGPAALIPFCLSGIGVIRRFRKGK
jgi:hypothetical protein